MKIQRIGYIEDGEVHYTEPMTDPEVISGVYKSFDSYSIASGDDIWVETIESEWVREG